MLLDGVSPNKCGFDAIIEVEKKFGPGVPIKGHKCRRCGHEWKPYRLARSLLKITLPRECPRCHTRNWK